MTIDLALILTALSINITTALLVIILLRPNDARYADLAARVDKQDKLLDLCGKANSELFRYVERLDDVTGGSGHHVLLPAVPGGPAGRVQHDGN